MTIPGSLSRGCGRAVRAAGLVLTLLGGFAAAAQSDFVPADFVRVDGKRFVSADGAPFAIRGISLGNWLMPEGYMFKFKRARSPREIEAVFRMLLGERVAFRFWDSYRDTYIAEADIQFIAAAGFNTVRVPLHYGLFVDQDGPDRLAGPGYALLDRLIGWCRGVGLKVIIDMHAAPGGQTGVNHDDGVGYPLLFYVPRYQRLTIALWRALAERYKDEPTVLGYDLLNEPISPYHDEDYLNPRLEPLYHDIIDAIREVDPRHVVFLAAGQWSSNFRVFGPPFAYNVAYTYHKFWATPTRDSVQDYVNFSNRYDVPLFLGETGELNDKWNIAFRTLNEQFGVSWCFWTYKNLDSASTVISVSKPRGWEAFMAVASVAPEEMAAVPHPDRAEAAAIAAEFLSAIRLENGHVNRGYLASLGLQSPLAGDFVPKQP
jgi:hypothetical protein